MKPVNMCEGPLAKKILLFTIPVMLTSLLQLLYSTADVVILGNLGGSTSVSAVGATATIINLIVNVFMGLSVGVTVTAAAAIGAKDADTARAAVQTTAVLGVLCGAAAGALGIAFSPLLLTAMRTPTETMPSAVLYIRLYFLGAPANLLYNFFAALLRAKGETRLPLFVLIFSGAFKILMTVIFVGGLHMDVAGAATATVLSQYLSAVLMVLYLCRCKDEMHLRLQWKYLRPRRDILWDIIRLGVPSGVQSAVFSLSAMVVQSAVNSFGSIVVAGNSAASNLEGFVYTAMNAFAQAAVTFTSQNMGARKYQNLNRVVLNCLLCAIVTGVMLGGGAVLAGTRLLHFYSSDAAVIAAGYERLRVICGTYLLCGIMDTLASSLRGLGYSVLPMVVSLVGSCLLRLVWIATIFQLNRTPFMLYISYPISWVLTAAVHLACLLVVRHKMKNKLKLSID